MGNYTLEAYERLVAEVERLEEAYKRAQAGLGSAAEDGNNTWHDNPAFDEAKRQIDTALHELGVARGRLADAVIIDHEPDGSVSVGSNVTIRFVGNDGAQLVHVSGEHVIRQPNDTVQQVSTLAPLGAALLGARKGDTVSFRTPKGSIRQVEILEIG